MTFVVTLTDTNDRDFKTGFSTYGELLAWLERSIRPEDYNRITIAIRRV